MVLIAGILVMFRVGVALGIDSSAFSFLYDSLMAPMGAAMFAMLAFYVAYAAKDMHAAFPRDFNGEDIKRFPIMEHIKTAADIHTFFTFSNSGPDMYIRHLKEMYGTAIIPGISFTITPTVRPLYDSGDLAGFLGGLRAAAEYELLTGQIATGSGAMGESKQLSCLTGLFLFWV